MSGKFKGSIMYYRGFEILKKLIRKTFYRPICLHYSRIFQIFKAFNSPTYYGSKKNVKSKFSQIIDYLYLFFLLKIFPSNYHLFGFDTKKRKDFKNYIGCIETDPYHVKKFSVLWGRDTILIHDKYIFKVICEYHNLPVPKHYGIYRCGLQSDNFSELKQSILQDDIENIVLKPRFGSFGAGINFISRDKLNNQNICGVWQLGDYIAEEHIRQHSELDKINPNSLNTVRIITFLCQDGTVEILDAILKTSSSLLPVDNFSMGGIAIGIDTNSGMLKKNAFIKQFISNKPIEKEEPLKYKSSKEIVEIKKKQIIVQPGRILERHPISQTEFHNFEIPYWDELKKMVIKAQKIFHHIKSIGWDVAIRSEGPVIIEGNPLWGTIGLQAANGGILTKKNRKLFAQYGIFFYE